MIAALDADALQARREIQGYDVAVLVAVTHVVEHFSWHVGQIVHMAKSQCDVDLSVYDAAGQRLDQNWNRP